jgi:hypothetical protein
MRRKKGGWIWPKAMFYPGYQSGSSPSCIFEVKDEVKDEEKYEAKDEVKD